MKRMGLACIAMIMLAVMMIPVSARQSTAEQTDLSSVYQIRPVHYAKLVNSYIKVRIACEPVSVRTLVEHLEDFQLVYTNGELYLKPDSIQYMGYTLSKKSEDREISFFDLMYKSSKGTPDWSEVMNLRIGDAGEIRPLADGEGNPGLCVFQTEEDWVISLYSEQDAKEIAGQYADQFKDRDIVLYLDGVHPLSFDKNTSRTVGTFLDFFEFGSLRLYTTFPLDKYEKTDALLELGTIRSEYIPEAPQLRKLSIILGRGVNYTFPDFEKIPSLEEIDLVLKVPYSGDEKDVMNQNERPVNISPSLKAINIYPEAGDVTGNDPDLRIWLAAQAAVSPELTLNGEPIQNYNLEDGMDDDVISTMKAVSDDSSLVALYQKMKDLDLSEGQIGERFIILVVNKSGGIKKVSTDTSTWDRQTEFLTERLAGNMDEADTLLVVYPEYAAAGTYGGVFQAYRCTTMIAAMDLRTGQLILKEAVATSEPPSTTKLGSGNNSGKYEIDLALDKLAELSSGAAQ